jgi:3-dehydroquinate synthase
MLDVAISLKQGINSEKGKNLVGAYFQPLAVFIDPDVAMPETLIRHGLSEAIKHAFAQDRPFFDFLMEYDGKISDPAFVEEVIRRTIGLKIELMQEDMFENNRAIVLQYGHEVGHAVEFLSGFKLSHGEAISIGMRVSAEISHLMSVTGKETVDAHKALLQKYGLPITIPAYLKKDAVLDALKFNKKTRGTDIRFALVEFVGKIWKIKGVYGIPCPVEIIEEALLRSYTP